jgi:cysteinyl-tRNA synthetase
MSKSVGNIRGLADVLDEYGPEALLLYFSAGHYRQPIAFSPERMEEAVRACERIRDAGRRLVPGPSPPELGAHREAFFAALADDFNTSKALGHLAAWVNEANRRDGVGRDDLAEMLEVFGLADLARPEAGDGPPAEAIGLLEQRDAARAAKDWTEADRLRDALREQGWEVRDGPSGAELVPVSR